MPLNPEALFSRRIEPVPERYTRERSILYALGVGAGVDDLQLVYEKGLKALPTMAVVLCNAGMWFDDPTLGITFTHLLHGEQHLQLYRPLAPEGELVGQSAVEAVFDKGPKGAIMITRNDLRDSATGELVATVKATAFLRADGGFGGSSEGQPKPHPLPERDPDHSLALSTHANQAAIYRLSGDFNPLHIDPEFARRGGFDRPILHGLCSYGIAARAVIRILCSGDPERLRRFDVRFTAPVFPGETLLTEVWDEGEGRAAFRVRVLERDLVVLGNGYAEYLAGA